MPLPSQYIVAKFAYSPAEGKQELMVCYYKPEDTILGIDQDFAESVATQLDGSVGQTLKGCLASDASYDGCHIALHDSGVVFTATSIVGQGQGSVVSDSLPNSDAVVIRKRTNNGGRTGFGRWFIGCVPEDRTDDNRISEGEFATWTALATALKADIVLEGDNNVKPQHYSRKLNELLEIANTQVDHVIRRQSRRRIDPLL